jgi:hypothetical protein
MNGFILSTMALLRVSLKCIRGTFLQISQTLANFVSRVTMSIISTVMLASLNFAQLLSTVNSVTCFLKPSKELTKATSITSIFVKKGQH